MTAFDDGMDKTGLTDRIFEAFAMTDDRNLLGFYAILKQT